MKLAIHNSKTGFHPRWIAYCEKEQIPYKLVDCYASDIIRQVEDCDALLWHHHHTGVKDVLFAKKLLFALEQAGKVVFPDFNTGWHFDDKVAQKYLLEAVNAPLVPSYVFYDKDKAQEWANNTLYPKVFKLKGGAGSFNVRLVKNKLEAIKLIHKSFNRGISQYDRIGHLKERVRKFKSGQDNFIGILKGMG